MDKIVCHLNVLRCARPSARSPKSGVAKGSALKTSLVLWLLLLGVDASAQSVPLAQDVTLLLSRALQCGPIERMRENRRVRTCGGEAQQKFAIHGDTATATGAEALKPPRLGLYPAEIAVQWRYCPWQPDAQLGAMPNVFVPYEDPLIGRCYILRPLDVVKSAALYKSARLDRLEEAQPYLGKTMQQLVLRAAEEGIEVHITSVVRSPHPQAVKVEKSVKKRGKWRKVKVRTREYKSGLHPFGLAVDVTLGWEERPTHPIGDYRRRGSSYRKWQKLGEIAEEMGLVWLGRVMVAEIFHFELHPGWPGRARGKLLHQLLQLRRHGGVPATWKLLAYQPETESPFQALKDPLR